MGNSDHGTAYTSQPPPMPQKAFRGLFQGSAAVNYSSISQGRLGRFRSRLSISMPSISHGKLNLIRTPN